MSRFQFQLATLRKLRDSHRDEMRGRLAEAYRALQMLEEQLTEVQTELKNVQSRQRRTMANSTPEVNTLLESQRYLSVLRAQQSTMEGQRGVLAAEVERRRQAVVEADRQVRILDKLEDKQRALHQRKQQRAEQIVMDEIAARQAEVHETWV